MKNVIRLSLLLFMLFILPFNTLAEENYVYWDSGIGGTEKTLNNYFISNSFGDLSSITEITFDNIEVSHNIINTEQSHDISKSKDQSVMAKIDGTTLKIQFSGKLVWNEDSSYLFSGLNCVDTLTGLEYVDTSNVTNMSFMFNRCKALENLDLSSFDTSNVTEMCNMFFRCEALESLDLCNFNTSKVEDMSYMFAECSGLKNVNLSSFNTSNVTGMHGMFEVCSGLENLDLSSFDTSKVEDMSWMFEECSGLKNVNLSSFDTSNVDDMCSMFAECSGLENLDLSSFDTSNVDDMSNMFNECSLLKTIYVSEDWGVPENSYYMFYDCTELIGSNGTEYDSTNTDGEYAKVDREGTTGYFTLRKFIVIFNSNGGNEIERQSLSKNEKVTEPSNPKKVGSQFVNWYTDEELTEVYDFNTGVLGDMVLYAKWDINNPQTGDNIIKYIIITFMSLFALIIIKKIEKYN